MAINTNLEHADIDDLMLDPKNPRLGRRNIDANRSDDELLKEMLRCNLEEIAHSFIEAKVFWPQEAVIVVKEELRGENALVVVEGNRRVATLKWLKKCREGSPPRRSWETQFPVEDLPDDLFSEVPYFLADSRADVDDFLGFRHVTGIKPWAAADKAYFMAQLLERGESYDDVRRSVGSTNTTVKSNYLAYRVLLQIEDGVEEFDPDSAKNRFTPLYMLLKTSGAKQYLGIPEEVDPNPDCRPVPQSHSEQLSHFSRWVFGTEEIDPILKDTRQVSQFGKVLLDDEARTYLERDENADLSIALRKIGDEREETIQHVKLAADHAGAALSTAHLYAQSEELRRAVDRLQRTSERLSETVVQNPHNDQPS